MKKVLILGGGVAGMSAAHELVERGYSVTVFEAEGQPGGKARSMGKAGTGTDGREDLPGEHGFRFFPGFYRHVTHTMKRIPFGTKSVYENLVSTNRAMLAREGRRENVLITQFPRNLKDLVAALRMAFGTDWGIPDDEIVFFARRLLVLATSCRKRRFEHWERVPWWDFIGAAERSEAYQRFLAIGMTRSLVALKAEVGNTKSLGYTLLKLLFDIADPLGTSMDRVLNGPTNDVWITPWLTYLRQRGVEFHFNTPVVEIALDNGRVHHVTVEQGVRRRDFTGDYYIAAVPVEGMNTLLTPDMVRQDPQLEGITYLSENCLDWQTGMQFFLDEDVEIVHGHAIYVDSPWAVSSISQAQFWTHKPLSAYGNGEVKGILSVDICDWNTEGSNGKKARACTHEEVRDEVWKQITDHLNDQPEPILTANYLDWFLDPAIEYDATTGENTNATPLLVNKVDIWRRRPDAVTQIPNLFLSGDYVRTNMDLASMEAANEAARRAVNGLLKADRAFRRRCKVQRYHESVIFWPGRFYDRIRWALGKKNRHDT